jgi:hypothetical protein
MAVLRLVLLISLVALTVRGQQNSPQQPSAPSRLVPPASCSVTVPPANPFTPPAPYELGENTSSFWFGTEKLWTALRKSGEVWYWAPHASGHEHEVQPLTVKTFWGSVDFNWQKEYPPGLKVTGRRLDGDAPPLLTLRATNAFPGPAAAMLAGIYVPAPGCWEITGEYKSQKLSFVVWVEPGKPGNQ